jgi:hypothetical protein
MKRSITRWTTTLATAALLGLPAVGLAQEPTQPPAATPPSQQPPSQKPPAAQPPAQQPPAAQYPTQQPTATAPTSPDQAVSPEDHLRQAKAALDSIPAAAVTGRARTQLAELKRHVSALEHAPAATAGTATGSAKSTAPGASAHAGANWGTEVAAIDKILTDLLGSSSATGTSGTAGATGTAGTTGSSKAAAAVTLDDATRAKLTDVRTHITAYAVGMAAAPSAPKDDVSPSASAASPSASMSSSTSPSASSATMTPDAAPSSTSSTPAAGASTPAATGEQPAAEPSAQAAAAPQPQVDAEAARRHLTAARDTLSQLTQLPAAAQLTGDARTQISQLISNFNELITTQNEWRASYAKVSANLNALVGPENTDAEAAGGAPSTAAPSAATPPAATPGAVGTSGTATASVDPAVRAKLIELRQHLAEFSKASGGAEK